MYSTRKKLKIQGKKPSHRKSLVRSQVLELIRAERIKTTPTKGKLLKQKFDRLVTEAKKDTFASRRNVENYLQNDKAVNKFYNVILPRLGESNSGYIVSARTLPRKGDNAPQVIFMVKGYELTEKKSRLSKMLEKQSDNKGSKRGSGIRNVVSKISAPGAGRKKDSTADTRRVST